MLSEKAPPPAAEAQRASGSGMLDAFWLPGLQAADVAEWRTLTFGTSTPPAPEASETTGTVVSGQRSAVSGQPATRASDSALSSQHSAFVSVRVPVLTPGGLA